MSPPPIPSFFSGVSTIFRMQVRRLLRGKKLRLGAIAAALVLFAVIAARYASAPESQGLDAHVASELAGDAVREGLIWGFFYMLAFLLPFLFNANAISEEVEGRTFAFLAARPVGRFAITVGKWAAGVALAAGVLVVTVLMLHIASYATEPTAMFEQFPSTLRAAAALIGVVFAYGSLCTFFGAIAPEAAGVVSALYLGIIEFVFSFLPGPFRLVSLNYTAQQLAGLDKGGIMPEGAPDVPAGIAVAVLMLASLLFLGFATLVVQTNEYRFSKA